MGVKISNLPAIVTPALTDVFPVVQGGVTYKETCTQLASLFVSVASLPLAVNLGGTGVTTSTGTTSVVLSNSPTLVTPTLGAATATSLAFSPTTGGIIGTTTNDNAGAGKVGEYISAGLAQGSAVSLVNVTAKTVISMSLTAGDWDVSGIVSFYPANTTTMNYGIADISTTDNTLNTALDHFNFLLYSGSVMHTYMQYSTVPVYSVRVSLAATTTVYLIAQASFGTDTCAAFGMIWGRRVR